MDHKKLPNSAYTRTHIWIQTEKNARRRKLFDIKSRAQALIGWDWIKVAKAIGLAYSMGGFSPYAASYQTIKSEIESRTEMEKYFSGFDNITVSFR